MDTQLLPGVTLRLATPDDAATFAAMHEEIADWLWARGIHQWRPGTFPIRWIEEAIARGEVYVASEGGAVLGAVMIQPTDPDTWGAASLVESAGYIHGLRVRRSVAGRGIGLALLRWAERVIAARGNQFARLDCMAGNPGLCAYYERSGYHRVGSFTFEDGDEPYTVALFEKSLASAAGG